ncbi:hypothetical protein [Actinacidiphila bryophytorum]|uniref:hypothetical protein n=1 Tax=Actinacidiphila bryophytorum TaxID=1436133 RepID=UPI0021769913|nr:hypothetical protein [Actinacidiphila bryophytorum]UWE11382.1 hypothetical protein NYE86_23460 [Actinacidiphila bryophytorum]
MPRLGPDGRLLAEGAEDRPQLVTADLDPRVLAAVRGSEPMLRDLGDVGAAPRARFRLT